MTRWPQPPLSDLPGHGLEIQIWNSARNAIQPAARDRVTGLYVCGITPYDATHLGHAATYVAFDVLHRALLDAGHEVTYVQNVTDVDDPLLERAAATGVDWQELAADQTDLFAADMTDLAVIPPHVYLGVVDAMPLVADTVRKLISLGAAYAVPGSSDEPDGDLYLDVRADAHFGSVSHLPRPEMLRLFAERGGDPDRPGKRDALDPLLWRVARAGEPSWSPPGLPPGRPGWHVECTAIALEHLGMGFDIQGGGSDLVFPHHEMGASHADLLTGAYPYAHVYAHAGMVGLDGHKMSKSRGNLVLVSALTSQGTDARAIRLALLAHHYRSDWEWTSQDLETALERLSSWSAAVARNGAPDAEPVLAAVRQHLANDLDAPAALTVIDEWSATEGDDAAAPALVADVAETLLGVRLRH